MSPSVASNPILFPHRGQLRSARSFRGEELALLGFSGFCPLFTSLTFGFGTLPLSFFCPSSSASSGLVKLLEWITECGTLMLFIAVFDLWKYVRGA